MIHIRKPCVKNDTWFTIKVNPECFSFRSLYCLVIQKLWMEDVWVPGLIMLYIRGTPRGLCVNSASGCCLSVWVFEIMVVAGSVCDLGLVLGMPLRKHAQTLHTLIVKRLWPLLMAPSSHFFSHTAAILSAHVAAWSDVCIPVFWLTAFFFIHMGRDKIQG